jgi:hypothetical protein
MMLPGIPGGVAG